MCGEIHLGTPGRNFLFTKPFCGENVLLHSKSNWNVSTIILVRIQIVSIEEYFKLFGFGEAFKLRQYIITFTVQNFLLSRKNSANKEVCNSFFSANFTSISSPFGTNISSLSESHPKTHQRIINNWRMKTNRETSTWLRKCLNKD